MRPAGFRGRLTRHDVKRPGSLIKKPWEEPEPELLFKQSVSRNQKPARSSSASKGTGDKRYGKTIISKATKTIRLLEKQYQ